MISDIVINNVIISDIISNVMISDIVISNVIINDIISNVIICDIIISNVVISDVGKCWLLINIFMIFFFFVGTNLI